MALSGCFEKYQVFRGDSGMVCYDKSALEVDVRNLIHLNYIAIPPL